MLADSNKQLVRRLFEDYLNTGAYERLGDVLSPTFTSSTGLRGVAAFATPVGRLRAAFPDLAYSIEEIVGDGDRVAVRWTWHGTFTKTYVGTIGTVEPNGKKIENNGFAMFEIADGKIVRAALETDRLGFLVAIGALPDNPGYSPGPPKR
jgi:predicted ester cyclase